MVKWYIGHCKLKFYRLMFKYEINAFDNSNGVKEKVFHMKRAHGYLQKMLNAVASEL